MSKSILITGGAGFIGSNMLLFLLKKYPKYKFTVLDALTYAGDVRNIPEAVYKLPNFRFVYGDVRNSKLVDHLISQVNTVIHFAAETHVARSIYDDNNFFETDVLGTRNIANAVLRFKNNIDRFIHISTSEVYGTALTPKMSEDHPLNPQSPYAAAKAGADRLVYSYYKTYKIPAVIIRPFNMFGPHQHLEKAIPRFITNCLLKEPLTIHGSGDSSRDYTYVEDLASAIDLVMHAPGKLVIGEVFNVGSGDHRAIKDIADLIMAKIGKSKGLKQNFTPYTLNIGDRPGQVYRHTADIAKIYKVLKWRPKVNFKNGLDKTIDWYVANQEWWKSKLWMRHVQIETEDGKLELH